jgi:branched-chain amino acid transport system permease protein
MKEAGIVSIITHHRKKAPLDLLPVISAILALTLLPPLLSVHLQTMLTKALIFGIFALGLNLIYGYTGLFSLGHASFFAVAGYSAGILTIRYGIESFFIIAPVSVLMATIVAAVFGIVSLRVSGICFLLVTMALGQLIYSVAWKWKAMTGGSNGLAGIPHPVLGVVQGTWNPIVFYYFGFLVFIICYFLLYRIVNSPFGLVLQGICQDEGRAKSLGYNTWLYKYIAFLASGMFSGVAGELYAHFNGLMIPSHAGLMTSSFVMLMVIVGSDKVFFGPVVGAIAIVFLEHFMSLYFPERWPLILGIVFIISVLFLRGGLTMPLVNVWNRMRYQRGSAEG